MSPTYRSTFLGIQVLRGFAAMLVVLGHATQLWRVRVHGDINAWGWPNATDGVDIFFVISGFVMTITSTGSRHMRPVVFLKRRVLRVAPMYWICTVIMIGAVAARNIGDHRSIQQLLPVNVLASFFFLPSHNAIGNVAPVLSVGWTLNFEMFFYLLFAVALQSSRPLVILLLLVGAFGLLGVYIPPRWPPIASLANPILFEFLLGSLVGVALMYGKTTPGAGWFLLLFLGFLGVLFITPDFGKLRVLYCGLPALVLVSSVVCLEARFARFLPRGLLRLGDASYSLYLTHLFVLDALVVVIRRMPLFVASQSMFLILAVVTTAFISLIVYRFVEAPLTLIVSNLVRSREPSIIKAGEHLETAN